MTIKLTKPRSVRCKVKNTHNLKGCKCPKGSSEAFCLGTRYTKKMLCYKVGMNVPKTKFPKNWGKIKDPSKIIYHDGVVNRVKGRGLNNDYSNERF